MDRNLYLEHFHRLCSYSNAVKVIKHHIKWVFSFFSFLFVCLMTGVYMHIRGNHLLEWDKPEGRKDNTSECQMFSTCLNIQPHCIKFKVKVFSSKILLKYVIKSTTNYLAKGSLFFGKFIQVWARVLRSTCPCKDGVLAQGINLKFITRGRVISQFLLQSSNNYIKWKWLNIRDCLIIPLFMENGNWFLS